MIRILEKLSPKQAHLFHSVRVNRSDSELVNGVQTVEIVATDGIDVITAAVPLSSLSTIAGNNTVS